jgi:AbrB family looped-hinge helix DNA binding protein
MATPWYAVPMTTTIDKAGRVVIPSEVRKRLGLTAGTELETVIDGFSLRLVRAVAGPQLVRRGERLIARPRAAEEQRTEIDLARLIEEERDRWPAAAISLPCCATVSVC